MTLRNDDVIQVSIHGIIVGRAIVVGHEFVVGNAPFAGVRQHLNMAECLGILASKRMAYVLYAGTERINAARHGHSWYVS